MFRRTFLPLVRFLSSSRTSKALDRLRLTPNLRLCAQKVSKQHSDLNKVLLERGNSLSSEKRRELSRTLSFLGDTTEALSRLELKENDLTDLDAIRNDDEEMRDIVDEDRHWLQEQIIELESAVVQSLIPKDEADESSAILEVRAGTGGEEAALFASTVFAAYQKYAAYKGWSFEVLHRSETDRKGIRDASASVVGHGVFGSLKYECGVHRVQRVPATETAGRVHTSTMTVAVLPQPKEIELDIDMADVKIETFRAGGAGGQHVNKTDSAVRMTHLPTGIVVSMQDDRSQLRNRAKAMQVLRARLYDLRRQDAVKERTEARRQQIGTAARSEKIRTYNFPQDRVTDHRLGKTKHDIKSVLEGGEGLDDLIASLQTQQTLRRLESLS